MAGAQFAALIGEGHFGNDSNTKFLCHWDGTNGATTSTDVANGITAAHTITFTASAVLSTAQQEFGSASLSIPGVGDEVTITDASDIQPGSGNFTIDFWHRPVDTATGGYILGRLFGHLLYCSSGTVFTYLSSNGSSWDLASAVSTGSVVNNTWAHLALVRNGNQFTTYVNGTGTNVVSTASAISNTNAIKVGNTANGSNKGFTDELRYSNIARWTANFTSPAVPYS